MFQDNLLAYSLRAGARLSKDDKWLVMTEAKSELSECEFSVLQRPSYAKINTRLYVGKSLHEAVDVLLKDDLAYDWREDTPPQA